ncbi:response regulator [Nocardioides dongxiaopingii]|uniref:response regulator n=1 Tax=Nocardioides dongxiaopingii TaxID=2576036 RepID=UPI001FE724E2|nr:response regulator [Nocardioides dongxiaopingii]
MTTPPTVLIVDDDDSIREITQVTLEVVAGWTVIPASGGEAAILLAQTYRPDLVLLDLMMPIIDGRATFAALQSDERTADIPVVLLTAKLQVGGPQPWDDMNVAGVISKPFNPMTLGDELATMLGWDPPA